jgi:hypothetical protein
MPRLRNIVNSVATYLQNPDGSNGQICDRATFESFGVDTPEIIDMRKPLLEVGKMWNEGDTDTDTVVTAPAASVTVPAVQAGEPTEPAQKG